MAEVAENSVYTLAEPGGDGYVRVLWVARKLRLVSVLDLPGTLPRWLDLAEVEARMADGGLVLAERHPFHPRALGDGIARTRGKTPQEVVIVDPVTKEKKTKLTGDMEIAINRYDAIAPLVNDPQRGLLFNDSRGPLLQRRAATAGVSLPFLRDSCSLWWTYGQQLSSLSGSYHRCGALGQPKVWTATPGPRPDGGECAPPLTDRIRAAFEIGVELLRRQPELTYDQIHGRLLVDYFARGTVLKGGEPLVSQLAHYVRTHYPAADRHRRTVGHRTHARDFAPHFGTAKDMALGPGTYWEIDGTWGDHELVSELNRTRRIGRATIYLIVDVFSSVIMGFYVALRPFNTRGARIALANAMTDKASYLRWLGMDPAQAAAWPKGVMFNLASDHGKELLSHLVECCGEYHKVGLVTVAPARGDLKGTVEEKNSAVKALLRQLTGLVKERCKDRPATRPALTLREYARAVGEACWSLNALHRVNDAPPQAFGADGLAPTRLELFAWGLDNRCSPRHADDDTVRLSLLPRHWVRETNEGFKLGTLLYSPMAPLPDVDFSKRPGKVWARRQLVIDERFLGTAWLLDRYGKPCCPCQLTGNSHRRWNGVSFDEYRAHEKAVSTSGRAHANADSRARAEASFTLKDLNRHALTQSGKAKVGTGPGGVPAARAHELEMLRPEEAWVERKLPDLHEASSVHSATPLPEAGRGECDGHEDDDDELDLADLVERSRTAGARNGTN